MTMLKSTAQSSSAMIGAVFFVLFVAVSQQTALTSAMYFPMSALIGVGLALVMSILSYKVIFWTLKRRKDK